MVHFWLIWRTLLASAGDAVVVESSDGEAFAAADGEPLGDQAPTTDEPRPLAIGYRRRDRALLKLSNFWHRMPHCRRRC